jgi:hypothetical protein
MPDASYKHVTSHRLTSAGFASGTQVAFADRRVASDGQMMSVRQTTTLPGRATVTSFQVYRRVAG